jgi:DNA-binding NtrC family response regulator
MVGQCADVDLYRDRQDRARRRAGATSGESGRKELVARAIHIIPAGAGCPWRSTAALPVNSIRSHRPRRARSLARISAKGSLESAEGGVLDDHDLPLESQGSLRCLSKVQLRPSPPRRSAWTRVIAARTSTCRFRQAAISARISTG